ncbi:hypothetical protein NOS3756_26320 [Nostoc sp. NIES-3756]|nr:hypothetical protein NOS3756_26320 [Nostoc sp. NIES-3756]
MQMTIRNFSIDYVYCCNLEFDYAHLYVLINIFTYCDTPGTDLYLRQARSILAKWQLIN